MCIRDSAYPGAGGNPRTITISKGPKISALAPCVGGGGQANISCMPPLTCDSEFPKSVSKKSENKMLDICSGMRYEKEWKSDLRIPLM